jgi:MtrB/PioB family decaheme-associated outer membrane protein
MKRVLITSLVAMAAYSAPLYAEDLTGNIEVGGTLSDIRNNKAKFNEYRDVGTGITGSILLDYYGKDYFFNLNGEGFGFNADMKKMRNNQSFSATAGKQDEFKYSLFYNETPHNLTYGARTLYSGVGSTTLTAPVANNATAAVGLPFYTNAFDYTIDRKNFGGGMEFSFKSPFFFNLSVESNTTEGLLPIGTYLGALKELPAPVSYKTDNLYASAGYRSNSLIATLDGTISNFSNSNKTFSHAYTGPTSATVYLAPDSMYYKIGGNVMYRAPFWDTTFMARASYSESTNDTALTEGTSSIGGTFNGKITYTTASAAISSNPIKPLDVKLYLNVLDKKNESPTGFIYGSALAADAATNTTEKFGYNKLNGGFDLSYKLPAKTKASAGYEYLRINRTMNFAIFGTTYMGVRTDAPQTTDHSLYAQVKNELFDWMSAKIRYQYLTRSSEFRGDLYATATDSSVIKQWWRPVDTADKNQHSIKAGLEFEPLHNLTFSTEYGLKYNKYSKSVLGTQKDIRHELYIDAGYSIGNVKVNPYFDLELIDNNSKHRRFQTTAQADPSSPDVANTAYNWSSDRKDVNYAFGINSDIDIIKDKLTLSGNYRYDNVNGTEDFSVNVGAITAAPLLVSNNDVDSYTKHSIAAKLKYNITKSLNVGLGYLYENLRYADDHYSNYTYMVLNGAGTMLTGAYANPNYEAHVGYMSVGYKF